MRRVSLFRGVALAGALVALASIAQSTRADVVNGDFESPVLGSGGALDIPGGSASLPGWTVVGNDVLLLDTHYSEPGNGVKFNANTGQQALDITGAGNTGPTDGVEQTVTGLITGAVYTLTFDVGNAFSSTVPPTPIYAGTPAASVNLVLTTDSGTTTSTYSNAVTTSGMVNWQQFTTSFTAGPSGTATIEFLNNTPIGINYAGLDSVVLTTAVPEPGPLTLCAAGLPLFLGISWFRNRRASR